MDPMMLLAAAGALGGGGKGDEITQNVTQSSSSQALVSLTNSVGGNAGNSDLDAPLQQSAANTPASPSPVYGQTFGPDYTPGNLSSVESTVGSSAFTGFAPLAVLAVIGIVGFLFLKGEKK